MQSPSILSLPRVCYSFVCEAAPAIVWRVRRMALTEALSQPFELTLGVLVDELELDADVTFEGRRLENGLRLATVELLPDIGCANLVWVAHAVPPVRLLRTMPRAGQRDCELLDGVVVIVDGERIWSETMSLIDDDTL